MNANTTDNNDPFTRDDADMLQQVLMNVRGSYPDSPYRQIDYNDLVEDDFEATA
jgi:hypothetical protein